MNRAITTLFMLMSVDGKISTGASDELDVDKDFPEISGVKEGLHQYYEIEQTTDLWSFNTGRVQKKMGVNEKAYPAKSPVSFVLLDNHHVTEHGVRYVCEWAKEFVLLTQNPMQLTIQSGGTLNGMFLRNKLIDYVDIVVAPILIGGKSTATLIDGASITSRNDLALLGPLQLSACDVLENSYIRLRYRVIK